MVGVELKLSFTGDDAAGEGERATGDDGVGRGKTTGVVEGDVARHGVRARVGQGRAAIEDHIGRRSDLVRSADGDQRVVEREPPGRREHCHRRSTRGVDRCPVDDGAAAIGVGDLIVSRVTVAPPEMTPVTWHPRRSGS